MASKHRIRLVEAALEAEGTEAKPRLQHRRASQDPGGGTGRVLEVPKNSSTISFHDTASCRE